MLVLVCIDDFSRFIVCAEQFGHELTPAQTTALLEKQEYLLKAILSDNDSQFKEQWKNWCSEYDVEAHFAYHSYPRIRARWSGTSRT